MNYLNSNNLLHLRQYGFRRNMSTSIMAIMELVENITNAMDNGKFTIDVFIDLKKAFDTVDHSILVKKVVFKGKGSFYIAQYPVRWTAQSALHFLPSLADLFIPTPTRLLREAF